MTEDEVKEIIDCEIDCIKSGNALTPKEQVIAITVCNQIKKRLAELQSKGGEL